MNKGYKRTKAEMKMKVEKILIKEIEEVLKKNNKDVINNI